MARALPIVFVALLLLHGGPGDAAACECWSSGGPPCQAAWDADAIFAGTVRSIEVNQEELAGSIPRLEMVVHFNVEQPLLHAAAGRVEIVTRMSSCDYHFTEGRQYLVYAWKRDDGRWTTNNCSRTRPLQEAAEDLKFLTTLPKSGTGARVYGRVNEWVQHPAEEHGVDYGPVENVTVIVRGSTFSYDLLTDKDGRYEVAGIPLGSVSVSIVTPFGFRTNPELSVEVKDLRACVPASFTIQAESAAYGVVADAAGRPVAGVSVEAVAEELAGYQPKAIHRPATTDAQGRFSFESLPPGAYVFGVNITDGGYQPPSGPATFLPGTRVAKEAKVFDLKPDDKVNVGTISLLNR